MSYPENSLFGQGTRDPNALKTAEAGGDERADILVLAAEVLRTRIALTLEHTYAGWAAAGDIVRHLTRDGPVLHENDDLALNRKSATPS